jgi:hypothetical protein
MSFALEVLDEVELFGLALMGVLRWEKFRKMRKSVWQDRSMALHCKHIFAD